MHVSQVILDKFVHIYAKSSAAVLWHESMDFWVDPWFVRNAWVSNLVTFGVACCGGTLGNISSHDEFV